MTLNAGFNYPHRPCTHKTFYQNKALQYYPQSFVYMCACRFTWCSGVAIKNMKRTGGTSAKRIKFALHSLCIYIVLTLFSHYPHTAFAPCSHYIRTTFRQHSCCIHTASTALSHYNRTSFRLLLHCIHIALTLHLHCIYTTFTQHPHYIRSTFTPFVLHSHCIHTAST